MTAWWDARSARERWLVRMMLALLAIVLLWLLVVRPLADLLDAAKLRHGEAVVALAEARAHARLGAAGPSPAGPVDSLIAQSALEAGFTAARIARQGAGRATVALDAARPQALFGWVAQLERRGLVVERLSARANADRTLSAEISLRAGGR